MSFSKTMPRITGGNMSNNVLPYSSRCRVGLSIAGAPRSATNSCA